MSRDAVFRSWQNPRARRVPPDLRDPGPHRHRGERADDGVRQHRRRGRPPASASRATPPTGAKEFYGEFLVNAQGEDVVAGIRTPQPIRELEKVMPKAYRQLRDITTRLERHYKDVQDFEFTIQDERLFMLQTRNGKRTGYAAVVIATDLVAEKLIKPRDAVLLVEPESLSQLLAPIFDPADWRKLPVETKGLPASPGAASGQAVFTADHAVAAANEGRKVVLVRKETVPDDIHGMFVSQGVLTATGGMTSHAAVVGRQMGKPSVVGAGSLEIDEKTHDLPHRQQDDQGRGLGVVRRPERRGEARAGGHAAERDPAGHRRADEARGVGHLPALRQAARLGGQGAAHGHPGQRRPARPGRDRLRVRRARHRAVPHRAHVLRRGPDPDRAAHDPGRQRGRPPQGARRAAAAPARRLLRRLQGHARHPGHHPHDRPAAPRVPAQARGPHGGGGEARGDRRQRADAQGEARAAPARRAAARVQPHARPPRRAARDHLPGDHRDADARHHGGRLPARARRASSRSPRS